MKKIIVIISAFFVFLSFFPSLSEIVQRNKLPPNRTFVLEHNYMFDYNFYLSRIEEGIEGRTLVVEKYYNQPQKGSFFQIFYLVLGKVGGVFLLSAPFIYHVSRILLGFLFLFGIGLYCQKIFPGKKGIISFLLIVTASSWPIPIMFHGFPRFATYMGWWSVIDSLQRITFIPHVLLGQLCILIFFWRYSSGFTLKKLGEPFLWGILGLIIGIIFPPTLIVIYVGLGVLTILESLHGFFSYQGNFLLSRQFHEKIQTIIFPRILFILLSLPSFVYLQNMFHVLPWSALALFDVEHRLLLPYKEYILALGPIVPLGIMGLIWAIKSGEKKLLMVISWVISTILLFWVFEGVPTQSPLRFTEAAIHIPLGILSSYFIFSLYSFGKKLPDNGKRFLHFLSYGLCCGSIILGLGVMVSMILWLTDQGQWRREATFPVPIGAEIAYPLKDFMDGVFFLRDNTPKDSVVLTYVTAGNFIPAYAGNFVYIGHANTPKEDAKEVVAQNFFSGKMTEREAQEFIQQEHIDAIYFGPQEREWAKGKNLEEYYSFVRRRYQNNQVIIYTIEKRI